MFINRKKKYLEIYKNFVFGEKSVNGGFGVLNVINGIIIVGNTPFSDKDITLFYICLDT